MSAAELFLAMRHLGVIHFPLLLRLCGMITTELYQKLCDASLRLHSPELRPENYPRAAFQFLSSFLGADQIHYANLDPRTGEMDICAQVEQTGWAACVEGFARCMGKYPMFNFDPTVNGGRPFFSSEFVTRRQFHDLDIYSEAFAPLGIEEHGALHVPTSDGRLLWFGIERGGRINFNEADRELFVLAQQHLSNAHRLAMVHQETADDIIPDPALFQQVGFTQREAEVACWLLLGKTNVEMSLLMKLHVQTVKSHLAGLFNKTGTNGRLSLVLVLTRMLRKARRAASGGHVVRVAGAKPRAA
jgi:DNA-binding CsgD family transcriptional regulator